MLDASVPGMAFSALGGASDFVQVGDLLDEPAIPFQTGASSPQADDLSATSLALVANTPPSNVQVLSTNPVFENGFGHFSFTFDDPDASNLHRVYVDWGDGSNIEILSVAPGNRSISTSHQYLDDNPSGTPADFNIVQATVRDNFGGEASGSGVQQVNNVAPSNLQIDPMGTIEENGLANLQFSFEDDGTLDTHTAEIDWGDGSAPETVALTLGSRSLTKTHQYLDDDPTGTSSDTYTVQVKLRDDDGAGVVGSQTVTVDNVSPTNVRVAPLSPVGENSSTNLQVLFDDPGTLDAHQVDIDWGDGFFTTGPATGHSFAADHVYADNGLYTINVRVEDDDLGVGKGTTQIRVINEAPTLATVGNQTLDEGQLIMLPKIGTFTDPGFDNPLNVEDPSNGGEVEESFVYNIDWGDGSPLDGGAGVIDLMGSPGVDTAGSFGGNHIYADNGIYTVKVTLFDDDGGVAQSSFQTIVNNVAPTLTIVGNQTLDEGQLIILPNIGTFTDPGFDNPLNVGDPSNGGEVEESFVYNIDWGDGSPLDGGAGVIDLMGSPGVDTTGSFGGNHIYADNGVYTVKVTLLDDDGGVAQSTFQATVNNVNPILSSFAPLPALSEGQTFTLASLGVQIEDPGFDNPNNPLQIGGSVETFTATTVDWGDGTTPDMLTVGARTDGSPFVPTTAELRHAPHTYADNGSYTVTLLIADDDGGPVSRMLTIDVVNVAPSLTLTNEPQVVDEGSLLTIASLGNFGDPGFDNLLNVHDPSNGGETQELFEYTIDWGDGIVETGQLPAAVTTGSPGVLTTGSLGQVSHTYADNNVDASHHLIDYTVTITLEDDDGGSTIETMQVTVNNVDPTLTMLVGTDIDRDGDTTLSGSFFDPGADTYVLEIDWSDGNVQHVPLSGPTPVDFAVSHHYSGPPNPLNPAADVEINALLLDDDAGDDTGQVFVSNPGDGVHPVRIDTTPKVPRLVFPRNVATDFFVQQTSTNLDLARGSELHSAVGDLKTVGDRYFELRVIGPDGRQSEGIKLKPDVLDDLPSLFRKLPDNRYAIYLVRTETNTRRLVLEVYVRNGKVIDPGDDTEGARDRPPTEETAEPLLQQPELLEQPREELPAKP